MTEANLGIAAETAVSRQPPMAARVLHGQGPARSEPLQGAANDVLWNRPARTE
jgi:hypothetical protein